MKFNAKHIALIALPSLAIAGVTYAATPQVSPTASAKPNEVKTAAKDANEPKDLTDKDNVQEGNQLDQAGDHQDTTPDSPTGK